MSAKSAISKEIFAPRDEKMLSAAQVKRRTKKKIPFLATGGVGAYSTFICLSVTNKKPQQLYLTKVKQFEGSSSFEKRSQWTVEQLRQVNGIDPKQDCPEFDLVFDGGSDQWQASSSTEKSMFIQILHHYCQRYCTVRKPDFINCPSKLVGGTRAAQASVNDAGSAAQKARQALSERGDRLARTEEKTEEMMNSAQQLSDTAHKLAMKYKN
ncbi:syntaxin-binding protein 6-like isoform X2 [Anguilla anguilla]|uniref:syntaxin-binding protein 6-like isoform X2 n=1 Tax=Anguilla anguilla TaxID=7936 RepID=UPI0015AEFADA|nr:syntaxin-binding protein 6-like isoform X2 [Anguilla anguilla]